MKNDKDNVNDIMAAASREELIHLEKLCSQFWSENMDNSNCLSVLFNAEMYHLIDLLQTSMLYICAHSVAHSIAGTGMVKMDEKMLEAMLKRD